MVEKMTLCLKRLLKRQFYSLVAVQDEWSIGVYHGDSPLSLAPCGGVDNPVFTAAGVTDIPAASVADPFAVRRDDGWYLFFEVVNADNGRGCIGYACSSDGSDWRYGRIILNEPFHLSYPYVFEWDGAYYMLPESHAANSLRLYKAMDFPERWTFAGNLKEGRFVDPCIFPYDGRWWMLASTGRKNRVDTLCVFYADRPTGPWQEHPKNPVISDDRRFCRCGGRVTFTNGCIVRYVQDDYPTYGYQVWAFEITELSLSGYAERPIGPRPVITGKGKGWNAEGMHNIDPHRTGKGDWLAFVDGYRLVRRGRQARSLLKETDNAG
ncbi:MAG: hypothetical protein PHT33_00990 [bacterium]|nr:hypothetical protein [bacterium]